MNQNAGNVIEARAEVAALVSATAALFLVLGLHLLPALFAGLLVHEMVHLLAPRTFGLADQPRRARFIVVALLSALVVALTALVVSGAIAFFRSEGGSLAVLLQKMAEIIDGARATLPEWVQDRLPADNGELKDAVVAWLREHAAEVKAAGHDAGRMLAYLLIGMVIGALVALFRLSAVAWPGLPLNLSLIFAILAAMTMTLGNLAAFFQTRVRRLLAYSTISQVGYLLMVLAAVGRSSLALPM